MNENNVLLKLDSVKKIYPLYSPILHRVIGHKEVLKNVNLEIQRGMTVGLLGNSGSGKTTIGKIVSSIEKVSSGEIFFENENIKNISTKNLATKIQMVFQNPSSVLNPKLTIGYLLEERIKQYYRLTNKPKNKDLISSDAMKFLDIVKLPKKILGMYQNQLSGGQRQRVAILLSVVLNPKLLILDEPLSSLDVSLQAQILNFLNDIKTKFSLTYLFITHDISLAEYFCDKIFKLENGVINEVV